MTTPAYLATIFGLGTGELVVIFLIILLLFGGANLPKLTRSLGKSIKEFKGALKDNEAEPGEAQAQAIPAADEAQKLSQAEAAPEPAVSEEPVKVPRQEDV
jgi:sec-independent protein translocase protein TatA